MYDIVENRDQARRGSVYMRGVASKIALGPYYVGSHRPLPLLRTCFSYFVEHMFLINQVYRDL